MTILITAVHVLVALFLIVVVLLQTGKRADLAGAFGGGGSQTAFGTRGAATVLSKATTIAAVLFMVTSISLAILSSDSSGGTGSVLEQVTPASPDTPVQEEDSQLPPLPPLEDPATDSLDESEAVDDTSVPE
jgi:preprotein translocase subunit SecG